MHPGQIDAFIFAKIFQECIKRAPPQNRSSVCSCLGDVAKLPEGPYCGHMQHVR